MAHPLIDQLRFTRSEFMRGIEGITDKDARKRLMPMNCISWNIGHLAWQEQRHFLLFGQGKLPFPDIHETFAYGAPSSMPPLKEVMSAWKTITAETDPWLDKLTASKLQESPIVSGKSLDRIYGNILQGTIYHYWYHTGENLAIRQGLGHKDLPQFVGKLDHQAPYRPDENQEKIKRE